MKVSQSPPFITKALLQRKQAGNFRILPAENTLIDFSSNDYLGLARTKILAELIENELELISNFQQNGSTGSRLISGNSPYIESVEHFLAEIFKSESALIFNSGYAANMGVLSSIPQKGDTVIYDELSHACIKDGIRLSFSDRYPFKHNNIEDLISKLQKAQGEKYIVVESYYSMDGDASPLKDIVEISQKFGAYLIVDEAHSTGIVGENGSGLVCKLGLQDKVFIRIHTFGKAMGAHGACVVANQEVKDFLVNFSRAFIYTTAMPLHGIATIKAAFDYLSTNKSLQDQLSHRIQLFKQEIENYGLRQKLIDSESAIQALVYPGNEAVKSLAQFLQENGFNVKPILSPTVKLAQERLRICLHAYDKIEDIKKLTELISTFIYTK